MQVIIIETSAQAELTITDKNGIEWTRDLIGSNDDTITWDEDGNFVMSQETYDWWADYIREYEKAEEARAELEERIGQEATEEYMNEQLNGIEFNDIPAYTIKACEDYESAE